MRQIKFRGKRIDNGEWVYGYLYKIEDFYTIDGHEVEQHTVGQFTGIKNRFGIDIYEGDKCNEWVCKYYEDSARFKWSQGEEMPTVTITQHEKITGNIHD